MTSMTGASTPIERLDIMYTFSHYEGNDDDCLAVYTSPPPSPGFTLPTCPGPCDRYGTPICVGTVVVSYVPFAELRVGVSGTVTAIDSTEGHEGATVWTIGVQPHDDNAHFCTATIDLYQVYEAPR